MHFITVMAETSDNELLKLFMTENGRNYAFNQIVRKYQERLYWHIKKIVIDHEDTNDLLQNTFLKAYQSLSSFREESQLYTWLYKIATNESLSFLRQKRNKYFLPLVNVEKQLMGALEADPYFTGDQIEKKIQTAILQLPEKQRIVFNMRYYDEMPYEKMAEILSTSEGALKASYHHALKKVEEHLKKHIED